MVSISDYDLRLGTNSAWGRADSSGTHLSLRRRLAESRPVLAPHYTELRDHGPTELARIVAARYGWRLTGRGELVDEYGEHITCTIEKAGLAMQGMQWFGGDEDGELWIDWRMAPRDSAAVADAVRAWQQANDPGVRSRLAF